MNERRNSTNEIYTLNVTNSLKSSEQQELWFLGSLMTIDTRLSSDYRRRAILQNNIVKSETGYTKRFKAKHL